MSQKHRYVTLIHSSTNVKFIGAAPNINFHNLIDTTVKERLKWNLMRIYEDKLGAWNKLKEDVLTLASNSNYLYVSKKTN